MTTGAVELGTPSSRKRQPHLPGDADIWVFVLGEMVIFSCYFFAYAILGRAANQEVFLQSRHHLNGTLALVNTLVLLTSSLLIALCVQATRAGDFPVASRFLSAGGACGLGFLLMKGYEWYTKLSQGLTLGTNAFFMHYYVMTGVHVLHVLIGLVFLGVLRRELHTRAPRVSLMEVGATYWHMVDFLWFLIFALLYLMR
jgi:nitric oxide reductase NorE protein